MRGTRAAALAAPALLLALAGMQIGLALRADLSPWLGGGFGMFATIDSRGERHLAIYADAPGMIRELRLPEDLADEAERARALPTRARLRSLAEKILDQERQRIPGVTAVRLEYWKIERQPSTLELRERLVYEVAVEAEG